MISGTSRKGPAAPEAPSPSARPPARAWLSCYCSPAGDQPNQRRYNVKIPRAALDRISVLGTCDGPAAPPRGLFTLKGQGPEVQRSPRLAGVQPLGGRDPQPRGAYAHTAHPTGPKASGRCSPSVRPRRSRPAMGTTVPTMHRASAAGGEGALRS